jgi:hypothetical protein
MLVASHLARNASRAFASRAPLMEAADADAVGEAVRASRK